MKKDGNCRPFCGRGNSRIACSLTIEKDYDMINTQNPKLTKDGGKMKIIIPLVVVFALILCLAGCGKKRGKEALHSTDDFPATKDAQENAGLKHIWSITDKSDFVIAMSEYIAKKAQYGENISALSEAERAFYITQILEMEVNNGGIIQFFDNFGGKFSNELVSAFTAIGAHKTAAICQKAINAFGRDIPVDWEERREMLDELESDEIIEILEECDSAFFAYEEDLNALNYDFVMNNKEQFT